ncbi:hypothetical protein Clacol_000401 [Clathrus columnatus]|uniref:Phospholipid/glycerol acyltransferase domain-containing protein n=1 Tax=Clathrus columnatus TaxID=1419009 RepID=A0AAV4ZWL9_9AGAM|nr:hypothetical protein Clacol_000401 [Clathrus columnatus]
MTAKSTQFGKRTFTSWLIESSGTLPLHRRMDFPEGEQGADNSAILNKLYTALEVGDTVCLFPEGMSRYQPGLSPLKTGVARIMSEVLSRRQDDPNYELTLLTCSITYMHRHHFRSDLLVTFNPPVTFRPQQCPSLLKPVEFQAIKDLTNYIAEDITSATLDAPSWDIITIARTAARLYAPLGTNMTLGDYVRVTKMFIEGFKKSGKTWEQVRPRSKSRSFQSDEPKTTISSQPELIIGPTDQDIDELGKDLLSYHTTLIRLGIKDDRIRIGPLRKTIILKRMAIRGTWMIVLLLFCWPGLILWTPVFIASSLSAKRFKTTGPKENVWDEIAQQKLLVGLYTGLGVWLCCVVLTLPIALATFLLIPPFMWMSLRFFEDTVSSFRAIVSLFSLLRLGPTKVKELSELRANLHGRIMILAIYKLKLPADPEKYFLERGGREKGRVRGNWESKARYFSITRRRKRDVGVKI